MFHRDGAQQIGSCLVADEGGEWIAKSRSAQGLKGAFTYLPPADSA
jgi:hypothetical protein